MPFVSPEERRRYPRKWVTVPVRLNSGASIVDGITINVSEGGMYVFAAANFSPGAEVEVSYHPGHSQGRVRVSGVIRRRAVYLYGIEFLRKDTRVGEETRFVGLDENVVAP
jgi:hypothetical protein